MSNIQRIAALALGLLKHDMKWEDPENSDIYCKMCGTGYFRTKMCPKAKMPSVKALKHGISRQILTTQARKDFLQGILERL